MIFGVIYNNTLLTHTTYRRKIAHLMLNHLMVSLTEDLALSADSHLDEMAPAVTRFWTQEQRVS